MPKTYVLDSYAILMLLDNEVGADQVQELLTGKKCGACQSHRQIP